MPPVSVRSTGPIRPAAKAAGRRNSSGSSGEESEWWKQRKEDMNNIVESPWFDIALSFVILCNAITIGVEQTLQLHGKDTSVIKIFESIFLVMYVIEFSFRFFPKGFRVFKDAWVQFDFLLIVLGILQSWIIEPVSQESGNFGPLMVLRTTRLFRLAKTMRLFSKVEACWMLVRGFMNSASIMFYSLMLLFLTLYIFACMACEIITKHQRAEEDLLFRAEVEKHWSSLPQIMLTLVRFASLDNMSEVYKVLVEQDPWLSIYFVFLILSVSLVLFHLLGAVIFSSVMDQHMAEQEAAKRSQETEWVSLIQNLKKMFLRIDVDGSGTLSRDELLNIDPKDNEALTKALGVSTPMQVFNALDVHKTGQVSIAEFVNIIWDIKLKNTPHDLKRMEKQVETMDWRVKEMFSLQHDLQMQLGTILNEVQDMKHCFKVSAEKSSNGHSNGHAKAGNGHAPSTNGDSFAHRGSFDSTAHRGSLDSTAHRGSFDSTAHRGSFDGLAHRGSFDSTAHRGSFDSTHSGQKVGGNRTGGGDKVRKNSRSPSRQISGETTDELIAKLRRTWEESLVFAFEHAQVPASAKRIASSPISSCPSSPSRSSDLGRTDGQAIRILIPTLASEEATSDAHPAVANGRGRAQKATEPVSSVVAPALPEEAAGRNGAPQPPSVTVPPIARALGGSMLSPQGRQEL